MSKYLSLDPTTAIITNKALADTDVLGATAGAIPYVASTAGPLAEDSANLFWDSSNKSLGLGTITPGALVAGGSIFEASSSTAVSFLGTRFSANNAAPGFSMGKGRGTRTSPTAALANDRMGSFTFLAYEGTGLLPSASFRADLVDPTPSTTALGSRFVLFCCPVSSVVLTEIMRFEHATGLSMFGANPVIDPNRLFILRNFTVATLPVTPAVGATAMITDATLGLSAGLGLAPIGGGTNKVPVYYDGAWKIG